MSALEVSVQGHRCHISKEQLTLFLTIDCSGLLLSTFVENIIA